jgi:predicted PurR-regulated permease PerM
VPVIRAKALVILAVLGTIVLVREASGALIPVFVSALLAYALEPIVATLTRHHVPRLAASALVYLSIAVALGGVMRAAHDQVQPFLDGLPATIASVRTALTRAGGEDRVTMMDRLRRAAGEINAEAATHQRARARAAGAAAVSIDRRFDAREALMNAGRSVFAASLNIVVIMLLTFLMLASGGLFRRKLVRLAGPAWSARYLTLEVVDSIERQIERYLAVRLLISAIVAAATAVPLWWLGVENALSLGIVAGILNVLPILGPTIGVVLVAVSAFLQFQAIDVTVAAAGIAAAVAAVEGNLITPVLTGRAGELNTVAVFLAVLFWGWAWGIWGLLLAIPLMVAAKAAADRIERLHPIGELLGR